MRRTSLDSIAFILLAIWLILEGLVELVGLSFSGLGVIMGLIALIAGLLFLFAYVRR